MLQANGALPYNRPESVFVPDPAYQKMDKVSPRPMGAPPPLPPARQDSVMLRSTGEPRRQMVRRCSR